MIDPVAGKAEERAFERHRRLKRSISVSLVSKMVRLGSQVLIIGLIAHHLGAERYGLWTVVLSATSWIAFAQLGIGPGLVNALAEANGHDDQEAGAQYFSTAFFCMTGLAVVAFGSFLFVYNFVPWMSVLGVKDHALGDDVHAAVLVAAAYFTAQFPLSLVDAAYAGYQRAYMSYAFGIVAQLVSVVVIFLLVASGASLPMLLVGFTGSLAGTSLISGLYLVLHYHPFLLPRPRRVVRKAGIRLMRTSSAYVCVQIAGYIVVEGSIVLLSRFRGPAAVPPYFVTWQLFVLAGGIWMMFASALWGAFGEAKAREDWNWISSTQKRLVAGSMAYTILLAIGVAAFGRIVVRHWAGPAAVPNWHLLWLMCAYSVLFSWVVVHAQVLNGLEIVWPQAVVSVVLAATSLCLSFLLIPKYGASGLALSLSLSAIMTAVWIYPLLLRKARRLQARKFPSGTAERVQPSVF